MNYIHKLQNENADLKDEVKRLEDKIRETISYIRSPKFNNPGPLQGYVNTNDVYLRLMGR